MNRIPLLVLVGLAVTPLPSPATATSVARMNTTSPLAIAAPQRSVRHPDRERRLAGTVTRHSTEAFSRKLKEE